MPPRSECYLKPELLQSSHMESHQMLGAQLQTSTPSLYTSKPAQQRSMSSILPPLATWAGDIGKRFSLPYVLL